jgi:hypothetical protein
MSTTSLSHECHDESERYEIRIKGHLANRWANWFDGVTITPLPNGTTVIAGPVVDQAALHGLLRKVRDLGVPLLSVTCVRPNQADASDVKDSR